MNQGQAQWGPGQQPPPPHGAMPPHPGPYGHAPYGHVPHGSGVPYGHPPPGQPYGHPMANPATAKLDSDANTWLLVALIGFVAGFGWITGPLCWIKGGALRRDYARLGLAASSAATGAWLIGMISTLLMIMGLVMVVFIFTLWGGLFLL